MTHRATYGNTNVGQEAERGVGRARPRAFVRVFIGRKEKGRADALSKFRIGEFE